MWYIGIILIIILFIAYMRSNMKNETEQNEAAPVLKPLSVSETIEQIDFCDAGLLKKILSDGYTELLLFLPLSHIYRFKSNEGETNAVKTFLEEFMIVKIEKKSRQ